MLDSQLTPADSGPAAAEVRKVPRNSPPRPRPRARARPRLRRASRRASSASRCSCILNCSSAMRARSASLRRTPFGLNLLAADEPRAEEVGAGVLLGNLDAVGPVAGVVVLCIVWESADISGTGAGPGELVASAAAALLDSPSGICTESGETAAAAAPRAAPPRPRPRPLVVDFGGIVIDLAGCECERKVGSHRPWVGDDGDGKKKAAFWRCISRFAPLRLPLKQGAPGGERSVRGTM
jgi:hypothetical protein